MVHAAPLCHCFKNDHNVYTAISPHTCSYYVAVLSIPCLAFVQFCVLHCVAESAGVLHGWTCMWVWPCRSHQSQKSNLYFQWIYKDYCPMMAIQSVTLKRLSCLHMVCKCVKTSWYNVNMCHNCACHTAYIYIYIVQRWKNSQKFFWCS